MTFSLMNPLDAVMWRCEGDPHLRSPLLFLALLDQAPDWERFRAGHAWAARAIPRLRDVPAGSPLAPGLPMWVPDREFDPARHLRRVALPGPATKAELLELAGTLLATPFDPRRPPWESVLVDRVDWDGLPRSAWLVRFHHSLGDGAVLEEWLSTLLSDRPEPRAEKPPRTIAPARQGRVLPAWAPPRPRRVATESGHAIRTLTALAPGTIPRAGALPGDRGPDRRLASITLDTAALRAAARAADVSLSAVFAAGMLLGLRRHLADLGPAPARLVAGMPFSLRTSRAVAGNRFGVARYSVAVDEPDPRRLLAEVNRRIDSATAAFSAPVLATLLGLTNWLPTPLLHGAGRLLAKGHDLQLSTVFLGYRPYYVSGARLEHVHCFGPTPGCPAMGLLVPLPERSTVGLTMDPAAVADPEGLTERLRESLTEVLDLR